MAKKSICKYEIFFAIWIPFGYVYLLVIRKAKILIGIEKSLSEMHDFTGFQVKEIPVIIVEKTFAV